VRGRCVPVGLGCWSASRFVDREGGAWTLARRRGVAGARAPAARGLTQNDSTTTAIKNHSPPGECAVVSRRHPSAPVAHVLPRCPQAPCNLQTLECRKTNPKRVPLTDWPASWGVSVYADASTRTITTGPPPSHLDFSCHAVHSTCLPPVII